MIASITGKLRSKTPDHLIVDVGGVGYLVHIPLSTYCNIPDTGDDVSLHIHTHVREDSLSLFGFLSEREKDMFLLLLGVSGIGPKLALAVLSGLPVEDLCCAIRASDDSKLCAIPGIGKKTAARMVLELKDKVKQFVDTATEQAGTACYSEVISDAVSALVNLGYKRPLAEYALKEVSVDRQNLPVEVMIREALAVLMTKK